MNGEALPFPRRPIPVFGETLYGFERRFAACTRFDSLGAFRHAAGLLYLTPRSEQAKWERLAQIAGQPSSAFTHLRWVPDRGESRPDVVTLLGQPVRSCQVRSERLRFCPLCLAEDPGPERRIHRQVWQLNLVTACPTHRTLLVDACNTCGETFEHSRKTKIWACACGQEMTQVGTTPATTGALAMTRAILRRFDMPTVCGSRSMDCGSGLPCPFDQLSLDDLLTVTARVGILASTAAAADQPLRPGQKPNCVLPVRPDILIAEAAAVTEAAYYVLSSWPKSAAALFASLADRNPSPAVDHPVRRLFATDMGYRLLAPLRSLDGSKILIVEEALTQWLHTARGIYIDGRRRSKVSTDGDLAIDVTDALCRLEGGARTIARIEAWREAGLIALVDKKVLLSSVGQILEKLAALPSQPLADGLSLDEWSRSLYFHGSYRRSDALRDILAGKIRVQRLPHGTGLSQLLVSRDDLSARRAASLPARSQSKISPLRKSPKVSALTQEERETLRLKRRIEKLRDADAFMQPGKLQTLLVEVFSNVGHLDVTTHSEIRCEYRVRRYGGRACPMRLYSVADALRAVHHTVS